MFPNDPRAAIAHMPYLLDEEPQGRLLVAGFDASGALRHGCSFPLDGRRPLDEPLLEASLWGEDITFAAAVMYSERADVDLRPLTDAWRYRGRTPLEAAWAGSARWGSFLCDRADCCTDAGHAYTAQVPGHDDFSPLQAVVRDGEGWRRRSWANWLRAIEVVAGGGSVPALDLAQLAATLFDIPIRDAVLAHSAGPDTRARPALEELLTSMCMRSTLGTSIPHHTCLAAMQYLNGDLVPAAQLTRRVLDAEEYSLARLLHNGLDMRAPASLLARSFAHFTPTELLAA